MQEQPNTSSKSLNYSPLDVIKVFFSLFKLLLQSGLLILISEISFNLDTVYDDDIDIRLKSYSKQEFSQLLITFACFYLVYIFTSLLSKEFRFLLKMHKIKSLIDKLKYYFEKQIKIKFFTYSFNYVTNIKSSKKIKKGKMKKIVSSIEKENLNYFSCRDVTGILNLDVEKLTKSNKRIYINLSMKLEYEIADDLSSIDINSQKEFLICRNRKKDIYMDFIEKKSISNFDPNIIVYLGEKENIYINKFFYILFTFFIPVIEIYKIYLNSKIKFYEITIRKAISTRFDLKEPEFEEKYYLKNPKLIFKGKETIFNNFTANKQRPYESPSMDKFNNANIINETMIKEINEHDVHFGFSPTEIEINQEQEQGKNNINYEAIEKEDIFKNIIVDYKDKVCISSDEDNKTHNITLRIKENLIENREEKEEEDKKDEKEIAFKPKIRSYSTCDTLNFVTELRIGNSEEKIKEDFGEKLIL